LKQDGEEYAGGLLGENANRSTAKKRGGGIKEDPFPGVHWVDGGDTRG